MIEIQIKDSLFIINNKGNLNINSINSINYTLYTDTQSILFYNKFNGANIETFDLKNITINSTILTLDNANSLLDPIFKDNSSGAISGDIDVNQIISLQNYDKKRTIYVDRNFNGPLSDGSAIAPYVYIKDALASITNNNKHQIIIAPNPNYIKEGDITIDKNVYLIGNPGMTHYVNFNIGNIIIESSSFCNITGMGIGNITTTKDLNIYFELSDCAITGNIDIPFKIGQVDIKNVELAIDKYINFKETLNCSINTCRRLALNINKAGNVVITNSSFSEHKGLGNDVCLKIDTATPIILQNCNLAWWNISNKNFSYRKINTNGNLTLALNTEIGDYNKSLSNVFSTDSYNYVSKTGNENILGIKTFNDVIKVPNAIEDLDAINKQTLENSINNITYSEEITESKTDAPSNYAVDKFYKKAYGYKVLDPLAKDIPFVKGNIASNGQWYGHQNQSTIQGRRITKLKTYIIQAGTFKVGVGTLTPYIDRNNVTVIKEVTYTTPGVYEIEMDYVLPKDRFLFFLGVNAWSAGTDNPVGGGFIDYWTKYDGYDIGVGVEVDLYDYINGDIKDIKDAILLNPKPNFKYRSIGDSITYGYLSDASYSKLFATKYGLNFTNTALGGETMLGDINANSLAKQVSTITTSNSDLVTICIGVNDASAGNTVGVFEDIITNIQSLTYTGSSGEAFAKNLYELSKLNILDKVIVILPMRVVNIDDSKLEPYRIIQRQVCEYFGVRYLETYKECGINILNYATYMPDKLHPNTEGQKLIFNSIDKVLNKYL